MALVDSKYRFIWGSCGVPGNSHDAVIFQATELWEKLNKHDFIPELVELALWAYLAEASVACLVHVHKTFEPDYSCTKGLLSPDHC